MKWNKKLVYSVSFLILSVASFFSLSFWVEFGSKLSPVNDFSWFMFQTFGWFYAVTDLTSNAPLVLGAIFLFFAMYFGITGTKNYSNGKKVVLFSVAFIAYLSLLLLIFTIVTLFGP